jgi:hypothetical protein
MFEGIDNETSFSKLTEFGLKCWHKTPSAFKVLRALIFIPVGTAFLIAILVVFDVGHHLVGFIIHILQGSLTWFASLLTGHYFPYELPEGAWDWDHFCAHMNQVAHIFPRYLEYHWGVIIRVIIWAVLVAILFWREGKRIGFKLVLRTVSRDQVYILEMMYLILRVGLEESIGKLVRWLARILSNEKLYEALKEATTGQYDRD